MKNATTTPAQRMARGALAIYAISLGVAGLVFLAAGAAYLSGLTLSLPFDGYTWYAITFIGCLLVGLALIVGNALAGATERGYLQSTVITLLLFVAMRVAFFVCDATLRHVAAPLLIGEIVLFSATALVFLLLRSRL